MGEIKKYKLEIVVFLCGMIGMGLELIAARVLSPYVGSSNIVWTSIIGIILASMSLGYWIGGKKADKGIKADELSEIIFLAAIATSLIPIFETMIVRKIARKIINLNIAAILCAISLFSLPSFILATISPIAVKVKSQKSKEIGTISGKISSLSTIGSIAGTFISGFILIPNIGVNNINIGITVLLIMLAVMIREKKDKKFILKSIGVTIISIVLILVGKLLFNIANPEVILDKDSEYSRIWVRKIKANGNEYKTLQVDTGLESYIDEKTGEMGAEYLKYYDLAEYLNKDINNTLMIGGAAYTYPIHYLGKYNSKMIDVVEIDKEMTKIAQEQFGLNIKDERIKVFHQDGRSFLNYSKNKYDTILLDAFKGINAPFELTTYEAMTKVRERLNKNGMIITNIISSIEGDKSDFLKYEYSTYKKVFDKVLVYQVRKIDKNEEQNLILIGVKGSPEKDENKKKEYKKLLDNEIKSFHVNEKIVTDNFAPIGT